MDNSKIIKGDTVRVGGFAPMSSMECYEGAVGTVMDIEVGSGLGDTMWIQKKGTGRIFKVRRQFCEIE